MLSVIPIGRAGNSGRYALVGHTIREEPHNPYGYFMGGFMRLFMSLFVASFIFFTTTPRAHADYRLPLEGAFGSITNFFVTTPSRPAAPPLSVDEVPHPMAGTFDHAHFEGRLDGLFCKRFIKEGTQRDCASCCEESYRNIIGHDALATFPTSLKSYYIKTCKVNCASR